MKENSDFEAKLQYALAMSTKKLTSELESQRLRETALVEDCRQYQEIIRRLTEDDCSTHQAFKEKLKSLEAEKYHLENKMSADRKILKQRESQLHELELERDELRQELNDERLKMSQSSSGGSNTGVVSGNTSGGIVDTLKTLLSSSKDDIEVSESKKVRLESVDDTESLIRRLEILEVDNKRLSVELKASRESRESIEARVDALEADKVRLEIELVKERALRGGYSGRHTGGGGGSGGGVSDSGMASSIESRDKDMIASVAVVTETNDDTGAVRGLFREKLIKSTNSLLSQFSISLHTCNPGDCVVVLWDTVHTSYIVLQESRTMYFLHSDCVDLLELKTGPDGLPRQIYVIGEVIDKQYCHAKKVRFFFFN